MKKMKQNGINLLLKFKNCPLSSAFHLFQTMVYSKGDRKGEILSPHLQIKAVEFLNSGLYKKESSTQAMEDKIKELEKENLQLKKNL